MGDKSAIEWTDATWNPVTGCDRVSTGCDHCYALALAKVWLGTSIESNDYVPRADLLRAVPSSVRFLSLEPLVGPLPDLDLSDIDWVIVGGESGPGHRPLDVDWVRELRDRCAVEHVA